MNSRKHDITSSLKSLTSKMIISNFGIRRKGTFKFIARARDII